MGFGGHAKAYALRHDAMGVPASQRVNVAHAEELKLDAVEEAGRKALGHCCLPINSKVKDTGTEKVTVSLNGFWHATWFCTDPVLQNYEYQAALILYLFHTKNIDIDELVLYLQRQGIFIISIIPALHD